MAYPRMIARLDIKGGNLVKGIHLEGIRVIGNPNTFARKYYKDGIDELIYLDFVASLYGRNHLGDVIMDLCVSIAKTGQGSLFVRKFLSIFTEMGSVMRQDEKYFSIRHVARSWKVIAWR